MKHCNYCSVSSNKDPLPSSCSPPPSCSSPILLSWNECWYIRSAFISPPSHLAVVGRKLAAVCDCSSLFWFSPATTSFHSGLTMGSLDQVWPSLTSSSQQCEVAHFQSLVACQGLLAALQLIGLRCSIANCGCVSWCHSSLWSHHSVN